jgi:RimJ/RimL family protein N-acetyltransferase
VLEGRVVRLEPLTGAHDGGLWEASRPPEIWTWLQAQPDRAGFQAFLDEARAATARREEFAFTTVDARSGRPVGMTRYLALRPADLGLEIGWTWLTPAMWHSGANVEAKLLQLQYAFETLGCMRVELKTHAANARSRGAMERLGARFEGVHRKHRLIPGIGVRDTAWYSVIDDEWPAVRDGLRARLGRLGSDSTGSAK